MPRWSVVMLQSDPQQCLIMAGLPGSNAMVCVGPPLLAGQLVELRVGGEVMVPSNRSRV